MHAMVNYDEEPKWEWQLSNQGFNFEIPLVDRLPLPLSTELQGRYVPWSEESQARRVLDL